MIGLRRCAPGFRNCRKRAGKVFGVADQLEGKVDADAGHLIEQRLREKARRFGDGKPNVGARNRVEPIQHRPKHFGAKAVVEIMAQLGDHKAESNAGPRWEQSSQQARPPPQCAQTPFFCGSHTYL